MPHCRRARPRCTARLGTAHQTGAQRAAIGVLAATLACGAVTGIIWALVNNAPWTTQHGVWMAVYSNHITDGFW